MKKGFNLAEEIKRRVLANRMAPFPQYDTESIEDLKIINDMITKKDNYNNVPIEYCGTCLKIHLKDVEFPKHNENVESTKLTEKERKITYCVDCGNTDIKSTHITEWEDFYEKKYGEKFLNQKD